MHSETIEIAPKGEGRKSRAFSAELVGFLVADPLWELGGTGKDTVGRPVWMAYVTSRQAARAFTANLKGGRPVARGDRHHQWKRLEIPKSAGFRYEAHVRGEGCLTVAYLPEAFMFSPAIRHSTELSFLCMPPTWWLDAQALRLSRFGEDARRAALATYFAALLDQRTPLPIASDTRFHLRLFEAACEEKWVLDRTDRPRSFAGWGLEQMGFEEPLLCSVSHVEFADFLAGVTSRHLPKEPRPQIIKPIQPKELSHGTSRISGPGRVLPDAVASAVQLVLPGFAAPEPVPAAGAV